MDAPVLALFGAYHLDEANALLQRAGRAVELQPKELAVLCELARRPGQLVTKDRLLDTVWGHQHVSESVLKTIVSHLRAALDDDARQPRCIETVSRRGYRFVAALTSASAAAAAVATGAAIATPTATVITGPTGAPLLAVPLAAALHAGTSAAAVPLVGRDDAHAHLQRALRAALARRRQLLLVAGEAGIGKTTLIDAFAAGAAAQGLAVARGQCVEHYGSGEPYMPVLEALDMLCRAEAEWLSLLRRVAPSWLVQMPWHLAEGERRELQREVAGVTQERMLREMGELLDRGCELRPLVLVLEDLHWSDHATVQLIAYLARRRTAAALLVLASLRPAEVIAESHPLAGLRQELRLQRLSDEIDLEAFSEADVGALLARRVGEAPESFVQALHQHTGGLPLFVASMLDELIGGDGREGGQRGDGGDTGGDLRDPSGPHPAALHDGAGWRFPDAAAELAVPARIADVLAVRFSRLPAEVQQALAAASVAGTEFLHLPLAQAMQWDADRLARLFDAEAARGLWLRAAGAVTLPGGPVAARYSFRHALHRHVLYQRLSAAERIRWHRALGQALLALHGAAAGEIAGELALHFERGEMPLAAVHQLVRVARRALARSAAEEALRAVRQALALLARLPREHAEGVALAGADANADGGAVAVLELELDLRVLEGVALSRLHVLVEPAVAQAFEHARALCARAPAGPARARAQHGLWWVSFGRGELAEAQRLAQELLDAGADSGEASLLLVGSSTMGLTRSLCGDFLAARDHLARALEMADRLGDSLQPGMFIQDPGVEARAHSAIVAWWLGDPRAARRFAAEAVQRAFTIRHRLSQLISLHLSAAMHCFAGEMEQSRACNERLFEVIREHGLPTMPGTFSWLHGRAMAATGEVQAGLALMRAAEASCRTLGMLVGITGYYHHFAEANLAAGRHDDALASAEKGLALARKGPEQYVLSALHRVRAELLHARGDGEAAAGALQAALAVAVRQRAGFHELAALTSGLRLALLPPPAAQPARERVRELLAAYAGESIPLVRAAGEQVSV